jgi:hypothetical protein
MLVNRRDSCLFRLTVSLSEENGPNVALSPNEETFSVFPYQEEDAGLPA